MVSISRCPAYDLPPAVDDLALPALSTTKRWLRDPGKLREPLRGGAILLDRAAMFVSTEHRHSDSSDDKEE